MAWADTKCRRIVQGRDQHCPACHHTFTSTAAGDLHRTGPHDNIRDAWRTPLTAARRAALNKLHAM